jgi:hypothetical protein
MTDNETVRDEEWRALTPSTAAESKRVLDRRLKWSRNRTPPEGFTGGEDYRAWLLRVVDVLATNDVTEDERIETASHRARIMEYTVDQLWAEYQSTR